MTRPSANAPMINSHPITPPPEELVQKWVDQLRYLHDRVVFSEIAQWGADQELEACCEALSDLQRGTSYPVTSENLQAARRPKPPSLKKQGIESLNKAFTMWMTNKFNIEDFTTLGRNIREALNSLPE